MAKRRNRLQIEVSLTGVRNVLSKLGQIRKSAADFGSKLSAAAAAAGAAIQGLIQTLFFAREAIRTLINVAKGLYDFFLKDAITAERLEVTLKHITRSSEDAAEVMRLVDEASQNLGFSWETAAAAGQQIALAAKDAQGNFDLDLWQELFETVMAFSSLRPDVPLALMARGVTGAMMGDMTTLTRLLDINVNQLLGLSEEADEVLAKGGQLQGLVRMRAEGVEQAATGGIDALRILRESLGATDEMMEEVAGTTAGTMGQVREEFNSVKRDFAEELLPAITEVLQELLEVWRENEDEIRAFANTIGQELAGAIRDVDWEKVGEVIVKIVDSLKDIAQYATGEKEFRLFPEQEWARTIDEWVMNQRQREEARAASLPEEFQKPIWEREGNIWEKLGININITGDTDVIRDVAVETIPTAAGGATPPSDTTPSRQKYGAGKGKKAGGKKAATSGSSGIGGKASGTSSLGGG